MPKRVPGTSLILEIIKNINTYLKSTDFDDNILNRVKSDIGILKRKSIGQKCEYLISQNCKNKMYGGQSAIQFFKKCYSIRSNFVHSEKMDISEITKNDSPLKDLIIDVLLGYQSNLYKKYNHQIKMKKDIR